MNQTTFTYLYLFVLSCENVFIPVIPNVAYWYKINLKQGVLSHCIIHEWWIHCGRCLIWADWHQPFIGWVLYVSSNHNTEAESKCDSGFRKPENLLLLKKFSRVCMYSVCSRKDDQGDFGDRSKQVMMMFDIWFLLSDYATADALIRHRYWKIVYLLSHFEKNHC